MKNYYKYVAVLLLALSFSGTASAATSTNPINTSLDAQEKANVRADEYRGRASSSRATLKNATSTDQRCNMVTKGIDARIATFNTRHQTNLDAYYKNEAKLQTLINNLKADGKDASELEADLKVLDVKIKAFNDQVLVVQANLETTKKYACGTSNGQFRESAKQAQDSRKVAINMAKDIRDYIQNTIKPDVAALREANNATSTVKVRN